MEKCHNHPHVSAIGKCIICNKNLCELCAYIIDGKIYCKTHADEILSKKAPPIKRITIPKLTSNLLFLIGIMGIITIFLLPLGIISATTLFAMLIFHTGIPFYFLAGYFVRERKRRGVALGAWLVIMSLLQTLYSLTELPLSQYFSIEFIDILAIAALIAFRIFLIILLILCWKEFKTF